MHGIVINLDSRPDRLAEFRKQQFPFEVERFSAIKVTPGEDGCTQSHLAVIGAQTEFPFVVFEDDCIMLQPWTAVEMCMKQLPNKWDALWLGANVKEPISKYSENLYRLCNAYALHAVIYNSKEMVDYILKYHNTPSGKNLDIFYRFAVQKKFRCFLTYPMFATQRVDVSDICGKITGHEELEYNYKKNVK